MWELFEGCECECLHLFCNFNRAKVFEKTNCQDCHFKSACLRVTWLASLPLVKDFTM